MNRKYIRIVRIDDRIRFSIVDDETTSTSIYMTDERAIQLARRLLTVVETRNTDEV